jgi:hypothetical protein
MSKNTREYESFENHGSRIYYTIIQGKKTRQITREQGYLENNKE